ncbi:unnamed protein product [Brachionus calyciflorus]|uniref:DUF4371 domain-containing protein n=1 Tax=Brachionus calyciflorus TaxID=104777 RepID=A0A814DPA5_9BILA|nr:unnamed protein product [Brachionus calyciflorus]
MILPIKEKKLIKLKIRVKNLSDSKILLDDWPPDSFKTGLKMFPVAQKYGVIIETIRRKIQFLFAFALSMRIFIRFRPTPQTDGESFSKLIKAILTDFGIPLSNIVGQCYGGAANMSGIPKGVAARIKNIHCNAHKLIFALQDTFSNLAEVRNCIGTVDSVYIFIEDSPKRHAIFEKLQMEKKESKLKLKYLSDTRWSFRDKALKQ